MTIALMPSEDECLGRSRVNLVDAVLFVLSMPNISRGRLAEMRRQFVSTCPLPSHLLRLEGGEEDGIPAILDAFRAAGHTTILVQPLGLPFPEGLLAWLPGALSHWQQERDNHEVQVLVGKDVSASSAVIAQIAADAVRCADEAGDVRSVKPSLGKRGWQNPPDFTHHVLVCTGPRCQFRDAPSLVDSLKEELVRQGVSDQCLISRTGCLFPCNRGPLVALYPKGEWYRLADRQSVERFVTSVLIQGETVPDRMFHRAKATGRSEAAE